MSYAYERKTELPTVEWTTFVGNGPRDLGFVDHDDEDDDRTWNEWFWEVGFSIIMWAVIIGIATGIAGLSFLAGIWGFVTGLALLR